jgi:hypothetical protein
MTTSNTTEPTVVARRTTADSKTFCVWSDGVVTQALGIFWQGTRKLPLSVAFVVADEVCLFDAAEVPALLKVAKKLARKGRQVLPGELRAAARAAASA